MNERLDLRGALMAFYKDEFGERESEIGNLKAEIMYFSGNHFLNIPSL